MDILEICLHIYFISNAFFVGRCWDDDDEAWETATLVIVYGLFGLPAIGIPFLWQTYRNSSLTAIEIVVGIRLERNYLLFIRDNEKKQLHKVENLRSKIASGKLSFVSRLLYKWVINEYLRKIAIAKKKCGV